MSKFLYEEILKSVYKTMSDGQIHKTSDLLSSVQKDCGFSDEQMSEMTKGGSSPRVKKLVDWARTHLKGAGLINKIGKDGYQIAPQKDDLLGLPSKDLEKLVRDIYNKRNKPNPNNIDVSKIKELLPKLSDEKNDWMLSSLEYMDVAPDNATIKKGISSLLVDAEYDISIEDLQELLNEAKRQRSIQYELVVKFENKGNKRDPKIQVDFSVKDNLGNNYPFKLDTAWRAVYLTFLYLKEGTCLVDFCNKRESPNKIFRKIYDSLYNKKGSIKTLTYDPDVDETKKLTTVQIALTQILSKIRIEIAESLPNDRAARQFVITDREEEHYYSIQGTTQSIRESIMKTFSLN